MDVSLPFQRCHAICFASSTFLLIFAIASSFAETPALPSGKHVSLNVPLFFEKNQGQADSAVRFLVRGGQYRLFLTAQGSVLKVAGNHGRDAVLRTTLPGSNPTPEITGMDKQGWMTNYLVGMESDRSSAVANYSRVKYAAVYPGVDLIYHGESHQLEYDFVVSPNAEPSSIRLWIEGANNMSVAADGSIVVQTAAGAVRWEKPVVFQETSGQKTMVTARYQIRGDYIGFQLGPYDRSKTLVIDPALVYGTYLDGTDGFERYTSLLVDSAGFAYVLGSTSSTDFPTTPGALQRQVPSTLGNQLYLSKLNQNGSALVWSTIIGGTGPNNSSFGNGFALDSAGDVFVVGSTADATYSTNGTPTYSPSTFPTTPGAYNTNHVAAPRYFLLKLNNSGSALIYSTFLSNQPNVENMAVAADVSENTYVTGTYSQANGLTTPFPCTAGAYQCNYGGNDDAFVMKFNPDASQLDYATLLGGSSSDQATQVQVDSTGQATIGGATYSTNYPITSNGLRQTDEGGFVTTLNSAGTALVFSTVLNHVLQLNFKRDLAGNYYVGGSAGTNLPVTSNAFQKSFPAVGTGIHLGFLTVIDSTGALAYSSYIAGNPPSTYLEDTQIQLVSPSSVTVAGDRYNDTAFPVTDRAFEQDTCGFLARFNPQAPSGSASLLYSGCTPINMTDNLVTELFRGFPYFAGALMYVDAQNHLYGLSATGQTSSNAFQKSPPNPDSGDGSHVWVGKYNMAAASSPGINLSTPYQWGAPDGSYVQYRATARSPQCANGIAAMRVYLSPGVWANTTTGSTLNAYISFPTDGTYSTTIVAYDNCGKTFSLKVPELVQGTSGAMGSIAIASPIDRTVVRSPVHYIANAQAPACSKGIAAMRIYTAPGVSAYTVNAATLNTHIALSPGSYNTVVQSWDNCGHVYKAPVNITVP